ncbi:MAG: hypothetical protein WC655_25090, partial [Candidatus Hydrogenedentales bacterium]
PGIGVNLPDETIRIAYEKAATQNVLAAVNPKVFPGYWSVCADGVGFGYGNTYPSLDGHQLTDALLWLGQVEVVKANWDYVKTFQRPNGQLPIAILPGEAGKNIGPPECLSPVDANGGLYRHWVPGDPLRALASPTFIQNADVIFRWTQDKAWLEAQLPSVNLAADFLASLTTPEGAVGGAGYYVERPTRIEYDGVAQCHAANAFERAAALNALVGNADAAKRYVELAHRVRSNFQTRFWVGEHFAEYIHPERGPIANHGLTDADWSAVALDMALPEQTAKIWPLLRDEKRFRYSGMPTGIAAQPETYEAWEFAFNDRMDLAAMGRVWYIEAWARARMGDGEGLAESIRRVADAGKATGYYWRERYNDKGGFGAEKYCEYPANLVRIVQRFLFGVDMRLDGSIAIAPTVPDSFWEQGFGQTLRYRGRQLTYTLRRGQMTGEYKGDAPLQLRVRLDTPIQSEGIRVLVGGEVVQQTIKEGVLSFTLPASTPEKVCAFEVRKTGP